MRKIALLGIVAVFAMTSCNNEDNCTPCQGGQETVTTLSDLQNALNSGSTDVVLTQPLTSNASITLPAANSEDSTVSIQIPAGGNDITITQPSNVTRSFATVNLTINGADNVTINTPNSSVFFTGDAETMSAATAANTLTIRAGSTVKTLTVNKGNVLVYGQVNAVRKGTGLSSDAKVTEKLGGSLGTATGFSAGQIGRIQTFFPNDSGWEMDRYLPASWESVSYMSKNGVFKVTVDETTGTIGRGATYVNPFYNTQGKMIKVANPNKSVLWQSEAKIYVSNDMMNTTTPFRVELWMDVINPTTGAVNAYPILGVANVGVDNQFGTTARTPKWRTYGYADADSQVGVWGTDLVAVTQGWHTVSIRSTGTDIEYYIDDVYAGLLSRTDPATPYISAAQSIMLQLYNYNSVSASVPGTQDLPDYSFTGYFADVAITIYE